MTDFSNWASWIKGEDKSIKLFIHKKCDEKELKDMFEGLTPKAIKESGINDGFAHIIASRANTIIYRSANDIYCIPAKAKPFPMAVIDKHDGTKPIVALEYEYPCEMKREDLVEY